jgi:hypothetical protein
VTGLMLIIGFLLFLASGGDPSLYWVGIGLMCGVGVVGVIAAVISIIMCCLKCAADNRVVYEIDHGIRSPPMTLGMYLDSDQIVQIEGNEITKAEGV